MTTCFLSDKQLREEGVSFSQEASHHLREIADAIKELVNQHISGLIAFALFNSFRLLKHSLVQHRNESASSNECSVNVLLVCQMCVPVVRAEIDF